MTEPGSMTKKYVTVCRRDMSADSPYHPCPECNHSGHLHRPITAPEEVCVQCQIDMIEARLTNLIKKLT